MILTYRAQLPYVFDDKITGLKQHGNDYLLVFLSCRVYKILFFNEDIMEIFRNRYRREAVEVVCPLCKHSQIVYFPEEEMPRCPQCNKKMIVKEVLTEGKY